MDEGRGTDMLYELLTVALVALSLIEDNRAEVVPKLKDLQGITKITIKVCQSGLAALSTRRRRTSCNAAAAAMPPAGGPESHALDGLLACVVRACRTLKRLLDMTPNYFGVFKSDMYLKELDLLQHCMGRILDGIEGSQRQRPLSDVNGLIADPAARAFWVKKFCTEVEVPWVRFVDAFVEEFGPHPTEALDRFMKAMVGDPSCSVVVNRYGRMTEDAEGIYELFQQFADPHTMIYVMGTVEDDSHGNNVSYTPTPLTTFLGYSIEQVSCGGQHAAILTTSGHIYTFGRGGFGRLGHGDDAMCSTPKLVKQLGDVHCKQVACGFAYTAAVSTAGQVYTWGAGENGRLGLGDEADKMIPHLVELGSKKVKQIFAGSVHTCALMETGQVYSWGKSEYTGHGFVQDVLSPMPLDEFHGQAIMQISVGPGGYHTIALGASGEVYTWGHNRVGQLGYVNTDSVPRNHEGAFFLPTPRVVESLRGAKVSRVIAGWGHSAVVCQNGDVYICGRNFMGQLGLGDPEGFEKNERNHPYLSSFRLIHGLKGLPVTHFACGGEHSAAVIANDDVYTFGAGARGQLGHGDHDNEHYPRLNQPLRQTRRHVKDLACGNNCTLVLTTGTRVPSLQELCIEQMAAHFDMYKRIELSDLLPEGLYCMLQRLRNVPPTDSSVAVSSD